MKHIGGFTGESYNGIPIFIRSEHESAHACMGELHLLPMFVLIVRFIEVSVMRGFTGDFYKGVPVFERSEYEAAHMHESEMERLGDCLGVHFYDEILAYEYARANNERLLYRRSSFIMDSRLRGNADWQVMWEPYKYGYVHIVTGEYVRGLKPEYDSYPCWCLSVPRTYLSTSEIVENNIESNIDNLFLGIAFLLGFV